MLLYELCTYPTKVSINILNLIKNYIKLQSIYFLYNIAYSCMIQFSHVCGKHCMFCTPNDLIVRTPAVPISSDERGSNCTG